MANEYSNEAKQLSEEVYHEGQGGVPAGFTLIKTYVKPPKKTNLLNSQA